MSGLPLLLPLESGLLALVGGENCLLGDCLGVFKVEAIEAEGFHPHAGWGAIGAAPSLKESLKGFIADGHLGFKFAGREAQPSDISILKQHSR